MSDIERIAASLRASTTTSRGGIRRSHQWTRTMGGNGNAQSTGQSPKQRPPHEQHKTEAQRLADWADDRAFSDAAYCNSEYNAIADELRRLDAIEHRHNEMMANPCPEWDNKAYMQAIANLRAQLAKAVAEEREACAKVAQDYSCQVGDAAWECAAAIRARSNT